MGPMETEFYLFIYILHFDRLLIGRLINIGIIVNKTIIFYQFSNQ